MLPGHRDSATRLGAGPLSPFDSLVFNRKRIQKLFNFNYRLEIYTPSEKRAYGYYVLPFLLGENLVGRVDVKADRVAEVHCWCAGPMPNPMPRPKPPAELAEELRLMAEWLGLETITVSARGESGSRLGVFVKLAQIR